MKVQLTKTKKVFNFCNPYIIAEIGANHNGDVNLAKKMIDVAVTCGCDAVKFQSWTPDSLIAKEEYDSNQSYDDGDGGKKHFGSLKEMVTKYYLKPEQHHELNEYCKVKGIDFCSSPFSNAEVDLLMEVDVPFLKIASMDINNYPYLRYLAKTESAIIISSGMANFDEITKAIKLLESEGAKNVILLHCISIYPAAPELINLNHIRFLIESFPNITIGYSDHTLGIEVGVASVAMGACVIEKHFTLDSSVIGMDNQMAMEEKELTQMVTSIKNTFHALGTQEKIVSEEELDQSKKMRRSLVAAKEMKIGDILTEDCLDAKRPGTGIPPNEYRSIIGRKLNCDLEEDVLINKDNFE